MLLRVAHIVARLVVFFLVAAQVFDSASLGEEVPDGFQNLIQAYCVDCHTGPDSEARLDLETLVSDPMPKRFADWRRVTRVISEGSMPPDDAEQPQVEEFSAAKTSVQAMLRQAIDSAASDPGPSPVRRLTNAEYEYCIEDLTGASLDLAKQLISDSVGGSGFTNSATSQFMQDATLERYLEAAKRVADHAMIGAGPIYFYTDPGLTGLELSAVKRIQALYRKHGFRASAGEGAKPYGMERYEKAFQLAWVFQHRRQLGKGSVSLAELANEYDLEAKFATHVWDVLHRRQVRFPLSKIVASWRSFPKPSEIDGDIEQVIDEKSKLLFAEMEAWQSRFAGAASDEEDAALLARGTVKVPSSVKFSATAIRKRIVRDNTFTIDLNNDRIYSKDRRIRFRITVEPASEDVGANSVVVFSNPEFESRRADLVELDPVPLKSVLTESVIADLEFGQNPQGDAITSDDFVVAVGKSKVIEIELPEGSRSGELSLSAVLDSRLGRDSVARCTISDITSEGDPNARRAGRQYSSLLRDPDSQSIDLWENGLAEFAEVLPQISHREPTPSDRDPIPSEYDNTYNLPECNYFHTAVKYYREDDFLVDHVLPAETVRELDLAWADLLTSFDYHDVNLRFVAKKFDIDLQGRDVESIDESFLESLPSNVKPIVARYKSSFELQSSLVRSAQTRHLEDIQEYARRAWRRPLKSEERKDIEDFYHRCRKTEQLDHRAAVRATLARVLVSPSFLYRLEHNPANSSPEPLDPFELGSRMSFSIWSSVPDRKLLELAEQRKLASEAEIERQIQRMLRSPKSRRMATEFFGQWLGFYHFDEFRGVDLERFPEFDDRLRASLYDEAISFFEYVVQEDRPYDEILQADYTFLNERTANHYGIRLPMEEDASELKLGEEPKPIPIQKIHVSREQRGGLLGLGAILASTSAPLRTSPVKRGDWILRRLIGTPVPPPPADAGSIVAEEVASDGMTTRERLEVHRTRAECMGCHVRIDPLGFALENYDSLGRWREMYLDKQPVDASGVLASGKPITGLVGLKSYLAENDDAFRNTFATKLVAYFLGRAETITDAALIESIATNLESDPRISTAVSTLVKSPQFRAVRGRLERSASLPTQRAPNRE